MQKSNRLVGGSGTRVETLESRRLLSTAVATPLELLAASDVSVQRSANASPGWRDSGALNVSKLPASATVNAVAGHVFDFTRATFSKSLPGNARSSELLLPTPLGGFARF